MESQERETEITEERGLNSVKVKQQSFQKYKYGCIAIISKKNDDHHYLRHHLRH